MAEPALIASTPEGTDEPFRRQRPHCGARLSAAAMGALAGAGFLAVLPLVTTPLHAARADDATPSASGTAAESSTTDDDAGTNDPLEPINRVTSGFNRIVRGAILDPLVEAYRLVTPNAVQGAVSNAASNLSEPLTAASSLLQGDTENAGIASQRFLINSTVGLGGTSDRATGMGLVQRREDLGQTFGTHGASSGVHIVLPILGPSNSRDAAGDALGALANPLGLVGSVSTGAVNYADHRDEYNALTKSALDPYVVERDAYEQHRAFLIRNAEPATNTAEQFPSLSADN